MQFRDPDNGNKSYFLALGRHSEARLRQKIVLFGTGQHRSKDARSGTGATFRSKTTITNRFRSQNNGNRSYYGTTKEPDREGPRLTRKLTKTSFNGGSVFGDQNLQGFRLHRKALKCRTLPLDFLSLGRVDPAPHTQHLLGPFEAIAQNSLLRSFSIGSTLVGAQKSLQFASKQLRTTSQHSELLQVGGAQELRATPSYSKLLRAPPSHSEWLLELSELSQRLIRATRAFRAPRSHSESLRALPAANQSY